MNQSNILKVTGRISAVEENQGTHYTRVTLPAPDAYSDTETVQVRSQHRLGNKGDDLRIFCAVGGYNQNFKRKDGSPGVRNTITLDFKDHAPADKA